MAHRGAGFRSFELVGSLNLIGVIFADNPRIIELWKDYYNLTSQNPMSGALVHCAFLDLLAAIGKALGYESLGQTDIAKYYDPQVHVDSLELEQQIRNELLRVLKDTARVVVDKQDDEEPSS